MAKQNSETADAISATIGYEAQLWQIADRWARLKVAAAIGRLVRDAPAGNGVPTFTEYDSRVSHDR